MKIAQVDVNYNYSSTGKIVADLESGLIEHGYETKVFFGRGFNSKKHNVYKISSQPEVLVHALGTRITGLVDHFSPLSTRRLITHLEDFKPDLVHLHDLHGYFINIYSIVEYLKVKRIPTVWTFHSDFMFTGKCTFTSDCEKWKTECNNCPDLSGYPKSLFFDFTTRMFREKVNLFKDFDLLHLVAPSEWLANKMRMSIVRQKPISVIQNGIDVVTFSQNDASELRAELGIKNEYIVLSVSSGFLSGPKGGKWLVELAKRNPDAEIVFVLVGVNDIPAHIPPNMRIIPRLFDQNLLAKYYSLADVLLLTSLSETFSMVTAESLACGTPVIGFDSGAPKEVALPGYGEFVPYGDLEALESLLFRVKNCQAKLRSANECSKFANINYSKHSMVQAYLHIYQQLSKKY